MDVKHNMYNKLHLNFLTEDNRQQIYKWIETNPNLDQDDNNKLGFASTYSIDQIPDFLESFKDDKFNVYNFIGFYTYKNGFIEPHVDSDFYSYVKRRIDPGLIINLPQTIVYYVDVCKNMIGGEIVVDDKIKPITNSYIELERNKLHSVTSVESYDTPRMTLVCEKYKILKPYLSKLNLPIHRKG